MSICSESSVVRKDDREAEDGKKKKGRGGVQAGEKGGRTKKTNSLSTKGVYEGASSKGSAGLRENGWRGGKKKDEEEVKGGREIQGIV